MSLRHKTDHRLRGSCLRSQRAKTWPSAIDSRGFTGKHLFIMKCEKRSNGGEGPGNLGRKITAVLKLSWSLLTTSSCLSLMKLFLCEPSSFSLGPCEPRPRGWTNGPLHSARGQEEGGEAKQSRRIVFLQMEGVERERRGWGVDGRPWMCT